MTKAMRQRFEEKVRELAELVAELEQLSFAERELSGVHGLMLTALARRIMTASRNPDPIGNAPERTQDELPAGRSQVATYGTDLWR